MQGHRLIDHFNDLNRMRSGLMERLAPLSETELALKPGPKRWSQLDVLQHLIRSEQVVFQGLPDPSRLIHRRANPINRINYMLVLLILKWDIPVPVPSTDMLPDGRATFDTLAREWDRNFIWLENTLAGLDTNTARLSVFRHPVAGPLTPGQALRMDRLHLESHIRQINRIQRLLETKIT